MRTPLRGVAGMALAGLLALGLSACGEGGSKADATRVLDQAFRHPLHSADLNLNAQVELKGVSSIKGPLKIHASGPFRGMGGSLPAADLKVDVSPGGGQTISTGFLSTGDRAFIRFQDSYYEQPQSAVAQANRSLQGRGGKRRSLKALGLHPRSWLGEAKTKGDETVAGVKTTHVSGKVDVEAFLRDLNGLIKRQGRTFSRATGQPAPSGLSESDISKADDLIKDASFDVYVGKADKIVRRVAGHLEVNVPDDQRQRLRGLEGGTVQFSVEFSRVNGNQRIQAPAHARPLSDLTGAFGVGGLGGGSSPSPQSGNYEKYTRCLEKADPSDTDAIQRCAQLVQ